MAANTVWGLDVGSSAIKAVKMVRSGAGCTIVTFDVVEIAPCENEAERPVKLQEAMTVLTNNHRFGGEPVYVSFGGNVIYKEFQLPPGTESKLREMVQFEAKQHIPFPIDQVEWGFERYEDPNGIGIMLVAVKKTDIKDLFSLLAQSKLNVKGITAAPLALFNFIDYEFKPQTTALILDCGAKVTDFVVMNKRQVYFRSIQIAGRDITKAIENKFKISAEEAEELKKNIMQSPQAEQVLGVIEPELKRLGGDVQRTMGFFKAKARNQKIGQCYLLGHTFRLPRMAESLQTQLRDVPFAMVEGLQKVQLGDDIDAGVWANEFPTMAVAVGLGLQGLGLSELNLNLIPESIKQEQVLGRMKLWVAASVAVILVTLVLSYKQAALANTQFKEQLAKLQNAENDAKKYEQEETKAVAGLDTLEQEALRWSRLGHDRGKINQAFAKLSGLKIDGKDFFGPENKIYLTNLYVSRIPVAAAGGMSEPIERQNLANKEHLTGAKSIYASLAKIKKPDGTEGDAADRFTLQPELRPDIPLVAILSGEVEAVGALQTLPKLEEALKKLPEVSDVRIERVPEGPEYTDVKLEYNWEGKLKTPDAAPPGTDPAVPPAAAPEPPKKTKFMLFHVVLRWNDPTDPDILPVEAAADPKKKK